MPPAPTRPVPPLPAEPAPADDEDSDEASSYVEVDMELGVKMQNEAQKMRALMAAAASASTRPAPVETRRRPTLVGSLFKKDEVEVRTSLYICSLHGAETGNCGIRAHHGLRTRARRRRCRT